MCKKKCANTTDSKDLAKNLKSLIKKKNKFTKEMAECISKNDSCYKIVVPELIQIEEINKNKEIMEIFLKCIKNQEITKGILQIKHNYDKNILDEILNDYIPLHYDCTIVKILIEDYDVKLNEKHIESLMTPTLKYLADKNKIKLSVT